MKKFNPILLLFIIFLIIGCIEPMAPDFPYELMLRETDLPQDFVRTGGSFPEVPNGFSHLVGYSSNPDEIGNGLGHQITIYSDITSAIDSFSNWEREWFTPVWVELDSSFSPINANDIYVLKCMDVSTYEQGCRFLQQHNNLIVLVHINLHPETMTYNQFEEVLVKLDARLPPGGEIIPIPSQ